MKPCSHAMPLCGVPPKTVPAPPDHQRVRPRSLRPSLSPVLEVRGARNTNRTGEIQRRSGYNCTPTDFEGAVLASRCFGEVK